MKTLIFSILILTLFLLGNDRQNEATYENVNSNQIQAFAARQSVHPGKQLLESKCYACHSPTAPHNEGRLGPPMIAVKKHYKTKGVSKQAFIDSIWSFVEKPSDEKAKMRGAVRRFGVMPYQQFDRQEIQKIGDYLYDNEVEKPSWFDQHWQQGRKGKGHRNRG